jgi:hypothetical protein
LTAVTILLGITALFSKTRHRFLPLGSPLSGSLGAKETVLYKINGTARQQLAFDSSSATPGAEWVLYAPQSLLKSENYYYESNRVGGTNLNSDFTRALPVDGTYLLALRNTSANPVSYNVLVNSSPATVINTNSGLGVLHSGTLSTPGQVQDFFFTAASDTLIYFDSRSNDSTKQVRLYNPDNTEIFYLGTQADSGAYGLTQTGSYKLQVSSYNNTAGNYSFQLVDLKASPSLSLNPAAPINVL